MTEMEDFDIKRETRRIVDELSQDATWDNLMCKIYVHQTIQAGLDDSTAGRTVDVQEVRSRIGLQD